MSEKKKNSWKLKIPHPPPLHHFSNGPFLGLHNRRFMSFMSQARRTRTWHLFRASRKMPRSPRFAHKAPVMQAISTSPDSLKPHIFLPGFVPKSFWKAASKKCRFWSLIHWLSVGKRLTRVKICAGSCRTWTKFISQIWMNLSSSPLVTASKQTITNIDIAVHKTKKMNAGQLVPRVLSYPLRRAGRREPWERRWMRGWQYDIGLIYYRPIFRLTK